jgi:CMP-N-acetylneuraminic acid synthetase
MKRENEKISVAIIPARSGSKRIPNKNFIIHENQTMVEHAIHLAKESNIFKEIIISLDNHEHDNKLSDLDVKLHHRPTELGADNISTISVIKDVLTQHSSLGPSDICCIYPCTPLLDTKRVIEGLALLRKFPSKFIFAAQPAYSNPLRMFTLDQNGLTFTDPKTLGVNTQNVADFYTDAGQFYWGNFSTWISKESILNNESIPLILSRWETIDIDEEEDLTIAFALKKYRK